MFALAGAGGALRPFPAHRAVRGVKLHKRRPPQRPLQPGRTVHPYIYENGTIYDGLHLDQVPKFQPIIVHSPLLEKRYAEYLVDKEAGKFPDVDKPPIPVSEWDPLTSVRSGLIAIKVKMYRFWDEQGNTVPVTVLWVPNCSVVGHKWPAKHGYWANVVAAGYPNDEHSLDALHWMETQHYRAVSEKVPNYRFRHVVREFPVTEGGMLPLGFRLTVRHFLPSQFVDICSKSKGKGFEGVVFRWGFKGGPASHGSSLFHRRPGSIGTVGDAMVRPGKKMPGHMGNRRVHKRGHVFMIDFKNDLLYIAGAVPGDKGQYVTVRDAYKERWLPDKVPPFPSFLPDPNEDLASLTFEQCQLRGRCLWHWQRDLGPPPR